MNPSSHASRPTPLHSPLSTSHAPHPWPAMNHSNAICSAIRGRRTSAETTAGIEILAAARPIGEMEMIASRIKRLIVEEGVKPGEIAVVFRSPQDSGSLAAEVFDRLGPARRLGAGRAARSRADPARAGRAC